MSIPNENDFNFEGHIKDPAHELKEVDMSAIRTKGRLGEARTGEQRRASYSWANAAHEDFSNKVANGWVEVGPLGLVIQDIERLTMVQYERLATRVKVQSFLLDAALRERISQVFAKARKVTG
jgi:hypothetical protein